MTRPTDFCSARPHLAATVGALLLLAVSPSAADDRTDISREDFFESRIRPVLVKHCYECHSSATDEAKGGLKLDFRGGLLRGGESGAAVVPGRPEASLLVEALKFQSFEMPPAGKLDDNVIADFEKWIRDGAADPRTHPPSAKESAAESWEAQLAERATWWSLQPPRACEPPPVNDTAWSSEPVDRFINASLEKAGLDPAAPATASVLLRRLACVLTGLPPSPEQVESFPAAYRERPEQALRQLVDELLASPHFGERFARHWMDVVRYTDTYGYEWDIPAKGSWEYRDYLIRAFNQDIGFDQMIREQIAGDLLPNPRIDGNAGLNESLIGPMFYHLGEHRHGSSLAFNGIHQEMIDNKIDAFSKTFLAMTVACARCHDHKLDAISQHDYYALAGVFMTPRWTARAIDAPDKHAAQIGELKKLRTGIHQQLAGAWQAEPGPLASSETLRQWAGSHREELLSATPEHIAWPFRQLLNETEWLKPEDTQAVASSKSTQLTIEPDGAVLASGPVPDRDSYTVTFQTEPGRATAVRLEALTHESLGTGGPGRTAHGNFVLTGIRVAVQPAAPPGQPPPEALDLQLQSATADYSQPNYPVESALKPGAGEGWGIGLGGNVNRTARFYFANPIDLPHGGEWTVHLDCHLGTQHVLGRFRLSIGSDTTDTASPAADPARDRKARETWKQLATAWRRTHQTRREDNGRFKPLTNFASPGFPAGWVTDGAGMQHGHVTSGTPRIRLQGEQLVAEFLDAGYHTRALSSKLPGALRVPAPRSFARERVTLKLAGGEWAGRREIPQNAFLNEGPQFFDGTAAPTWMAVAATPLSNGVTRVLTEFTTASLNSNFPPRTGVANAGGTRLPDDDEGFNKRSWFSVTGLVSNDGGGGPADTLAEFASLYDQGAPATAKDCWRQLRNWLAAAVDRWAAGAPQDGDVKLLNWMIRYGLLANDAGSLPDAAALVHRYRAIESTITFARSANSMDERGVQPVNYRLNIRGDVHREGDPVRRDYLQVFAGRHRVAETAGSGRLELARHLSSRDNPQTARVYVNRVWHWVFGTGLVATPNDFGKLGDRPSHPDLLDWLAIRFMQEGWSTKQLVRRLVLSQTFRQSGQVHPRAAERDPANRLRHHYPTRRLEAEAVRDSLLAVAGSLDRKLYGRPINPPRPVEDSKKRLFSGPLDSHGRRSLYIEMSIMEPPKFLVGFNLPDLKLPTGRRDETNVPAQALIMLNDPLVIRQAETWAAALIQDGSASTAQRVRRMFVTALGRAPADHELERWTAAAESFAGSGDPLGHQQAWAELAHTLFNTKEFIYYR